MLFKLIEMDNSIVLFYSFAVRNAVISELGCLYQTLPCLMSV